MMLDVPYQGNAWWGFLGIGSLVMLAYFLLGVRRKRKAGAPIDVRMVVGLCLWCLAFFAFALFQVLTHQ
jgi:LPXTG-motif cell wall-anchored protein